MRLPFAFPWKRPASAFFLVGVPAIYGGLVVTTIRLCLDGRHESVAWALCHFLTTGFIALPVAVVAANGAVLRRPGNPVVQLCAVHLCWNAHLLPMAAAAYPFLAHAWATRRGAYAEVLCDALCVVTFVCGPVVVATGAVKGVASRRREPFTWRHRAALGAGSFAVGAAYLLRARATRPETAGVAAATSAAFYGYAFASYLPANPAGDGPEITGEREWPQLRAFLAPYLWDPVIAYLGLRSQNLSLKAPIERR